MSDPIEVLRRMREDYATNAGLPDSVPAIVAAIDAALASLSAPKRHERPKGNSPIEELLAEYEADGCDHSDLHWVRAAARRYVETMEDSQIRCLLHALSAHKSGSNMEAGAGHVQGKPESAEAVGWAKRDAYGVLIFDHAEVKPTAADYAGLEDGETFVPLFTAPPRPEASDSDSYAIIDEFVQCANVGRSDGKLIRAAQDWLAQADARRAAPQQASAPVGVGVGDKDCLTTRARELLADEYRKRGIGTGLVHDAGTATGIAIAAIATALAGQQPAADDVDAEQFRKGWQAGFAEGRRDQQPAAVDEAIGRAFLAVLADPNTAWRDTGAKPFIDAVSVLAGQQQGEPQE